MIFRALWPITDDSLTFADLCKQAAGDLPDLVIQAHARLLRPGRFTIAESAHVPGSGRVTPTVLLYEAPAEAKPMRSYWKASA